MPASGRDPGVLGVDGCPAGWVGALATGGADGDTVQVLVEPTFEALMSTATALAPLAAVGVDIPIGLPDVGPRQADLLARRRLARGRKSSVFPTPTRAACEASTWADALEANRSATGGIGLSRQAFGLTRKIIEVDRWVRAGSPVPIIEVHPEVSFAALAAAELPSGKRTGDGQHARRLALRAAGVPIPAIMRGRGFGTDDVLDACASAWTARRWVAGEAVSLPDPPETFSDGIPAAIWV